MSHRSLFALSRYANASGPVRPEILSQNAFSTTRRKPWFSIAAVIAVIICTIIAATAIFTNSHASKSDSGVATTGDDVDAVIPGAARVCRVDEPINCRDSDVFHSLMRAAMGKLKETHFYQFGKPVRGEKNNSCHMPWRYKPKEGKTDIFYKDYRAFTVVRFENCTVSVVGIGDYHSGANARKRKGPWKWIGKEKLPEVGDVVNDVAHILEPEASFTRGKYLIYKGGGDMCKAMDHYVWNFLCMLGEAQYLNRTLVLDLSICLSKIYTSSGEDEKGKDMRFYFDFEHMQDFSSVVDQAQFWSDWNKWHQKHGLKLHIVEDYKVTPMKLVGVKATLIMRKFGSVEPYNKWCRVCEGEADPVIQRPWSLVRTSRALSDLSMAIAARMRWDFDSVHVERGDKVHNKELWPNLDRDTQPEALVKAVQNKIEHGRNLYIATDERNMSMFSPLKDKYSTHFLDDYKDLWDSSSDWHHEMVKLNGGKPVEFDRYMKLAVDIEVFKKAKKQIETFNDITNDCQDGINTCTHAG